jgi:hypothetical protein
MKSEQILLQGLIDYAGLFPPAGLDIAAAVEEYREARNGDHAWILDRFLCPTSRLEELGGALTATMTAGEEEWEVGAIFDTPGAAAAAAAQAFDAAMGTASSITAAELRVPAEAADGRAPEDAATVMYPSLLAATSISPRLTTFLEIPRTQAWREGIPAALEAVAALASRLHRDVGAKLRCGGPTLDQFPSCAQVARFITASVASGVPFKATAGLHHPLRHFDSELGGYRHGFLNILTATALAKTGTDEQVLEAVLGDEDPQAFAVSAGGLSWRDRRVGTSSISQMRRDAFTAYGSCSFDEPVADLIGLEIVGAAS